VTNYERAQRLFRGAEWDKGDMKRALSHGEWNIAIRRAQEIVECTLKGLLALMGVDYPKEHDVGGLFAKVASERGIGLPDETLDDIMAISTSLAKKRAPAFYFEEDYNESEAKAAYEGAEKVFRIGQELRVKLKGG
jgi:HEPN domain-containing protein